MKKLKGQVIAVKSKLTATVRVDRSWRHPIYRKILKRSSKFLCHNEIKVQVGDQVELLSVPPISKRKHYIIKKIIKKSISASAKRTPAKKSKPSPKKSTKKINKNKPKK
jgi:small subunit ribosomal protein S17